MNQLYRKFSLLFALISPWLFILPLLISCVMDLIFLFDDKTTLKLNFIFTIIFKIVTGVSKYHAYTKKTTKWNNYSYIVYLKEVTIVTSAFIITSFYFPKSLNLLYYQIVCHIWRRQGNEILQTDITDWNETWHILITSLVAVRRNFPFLLKLTFKRWNLSFIF